MRLMRLCCGWPGIGGCEVSRSLLDRRYQVRAVVFDVAHAFRDREQTDRSNGGCPYQGSEVFGLGCPGKPC